MGMSPAYRYLVTPHAVRSNPRHRLTSSKLQRRDSCNSNVTSAWRQC